ncbi:MAG: DUF401 family protein [Planctomycetota bacterium]
MFAAVQGAVQADIHAGLWALIKIAAAFVVTVFLVRRGMAIGYVLLIAAVLLGLALGVGFAEGGTGLGWALSGSWSLLVEMGRAAVKPDSLRLLCLVLTITVFGGVLKRVEKLRALADSLLALLRDRRWAMASLSSLIGLLPMPGGAMVSAPMVGEVAEDTDLTREEKTAVNHWMRHVWEYVDPLYPGLLMASAVFAVPVTGLMLAQSPLSLAAIVGGVVFLLGRVPHHQRGVGDEAGERSLLPVLKAIAPVLVVIFAAIIPQGFAAVAKNFPDAAGYLPGGARWGDKEFLRWTTELLMLAALFGVIWVLLAANRMGRVESWRLIRQGVTLRMTALVVGVCVMKEVLAVSGTVEPIAAFLRSTGLPAPVVIGCLLFLVGMLLGYTFGFVAICYPMLKPMLMTGGGLNYPLASFAFAMGFLGVMLSPVHLCLVLSREHFGAGWGGVYRKLLAPAALVFLTALLLLVWA